MDAKWATLEEMGLRSLEAVAKHILQENVWESNLIPDIAGVDYFTACTTGENGSGKRVVSHIFLFVRQVWGCEDGFKNVSIAHTVYANS